MRVAVGPGLGCLSHAAPHRCLTEYIRDADHLLTAERAATDESSTAGGERWAEESAARAATTM